MGESIVVAELVGRRRNFFLLKLLTRINSSCSSGRERRKSVSGMIETINAAVNQRNLEMVKYCVANECPIDKWACTNLLPQGHLECLKYLHEEGKAPWDSDTADWAAQMVISTYSNILLSVSLINIDTLACGLRPVRPLGLFEVLARNRQSALGLSGVRDAHREKPHRVFTIPPRQRLSITRRLVI